jgi:hypothetical protein
MSYSKFDSLLHERGVGLTAMSVMTDCEKHGMAVGCTVDCPVLVRGECEFQDDENKALYLEAVGEKL